MGEEIANSRDWWLLTEQIAERMAQTESEKEVKKKIKHQAQILNLEIFEKTIALRARTRPMIIAISRVKPLM